jgi:hypothetical protein
MAGMAVFSLWVVALALVTVAQCVREFGWEWIIN